MAGSNPVPASLFPVLPSSSHGPSSPSLAAEAASGSSTAACYPVGMSSNASAMFPPPPPPPAEVDVPLRPRQQRFVEEYLVDLNATQAAIRAGYARNSAGETAAGMLRRPNIMRAIERRQSELAERISVSAERVLLEYVRIGIADVRALFSEDGAMLAPHELPGDVAAAVQSAEWDSRSGQWKYKLHAKGPALESLAKHLGLFERDNVQQGAAMGRALGEAAAEHTPLEVARRVAFLLHQADRTLEHEA